MDHPNAANTNIPSSAKPLTQVIEEEDIQELKLRLKNGLKADTTIDNSGTNLLMYAASKASLPMMRLLLQNGADVNYKNDGNYTTLIELVRRKETKDFEACLNCLKEYGVNLEEKGPSDETAFFFVTKIETAVHLYLAGANINATTINGTPLHSAAVDNNKELAEYLLCNGAQIIPDKYGDTPEDDAKPGTEVKKIFKIPRLKVEFPEKARQIKLDIHKKIFKKIYHREIGKKKVI